MNKSYKDIILYSDDNFIIINKPSGLLSLPDRYDTAIPHIQSLLEPELGKLWIVHRLDKETSGIMILARNAETHESLNTQFQNRQVQKIYHAIVYGIPDWPIKNIELPLSVNGDRAHRTIVDSKHGKPSQTQFKVLDKFKDTTLMEASPKTGYTHQIRSHLASCGLPILMDDLYGNTTINKIFPIKRLFLHAYSITFTHPKNYQTMNFTAEYPKEFIKAIRRCQKRKIESY